MSDVLKTKEGDSVLCTFGTRKIGKRGQVERFIV